MREVRLHDDLGTQRIRDVDAGEILRRRFMCEPQDAATILGLLHVAAFADAAEAVELVMAEQLHVERKRLVGPCSRAQ